MSGWLLHHFLSCHHLSSAYAFASHPAPLVPLVRLHVASPLVTPTPPTIACTSASHWAATSHRAPLAPLFWLVAASPVVPPPPPVCLCLCLSSHCRLSSCPSRASFLAGYCVTSCHTTASHPPAPPPLIAPPSLIMPLSRLLSGWLSCHLLSRRRLPSACASASQRTATSCCAPLAIMCRMQTGEGLQSSPLPQSRR
jgi:hypothetical protein